MLRHESLPRLFAVALLFLSAPPSRSQTGFTTSEIADFPRPYVAFGDRIEQWWPTIASSGSSFFAIWYERYFIAENVIATPIYGARFSSLGEALDPDGILLVDEAFPRLLDNSEPDLLSVGDDYWLFYREFDLVEKIWAHVISPDGSASPPILAGTAGSLATILHPVASYNGMDFLVSWTKVDPFGVYYSLLTPQGDLRINSSLLVSHDQIGCGNSPFREVLSTAASGPTFLVVFYCVASLTTDTFLGAVRVDADGMRTDTVPIVIDYGYLDSTSDVIPYQDGWLVVYERAGRAVAGDPALGSGTLIGRSVSASGNVSQELFGIGTLSNNFSGGRKRIRIRRKADGFVLAWSFFVGSIDGPIEYSFVYGLDEGFKISSRDAVPTADSGSQLDIGVNDVETVLAVWSRAEVVDVFDEDRILRGGAYTPTSVSADLSVSKSDSPDPVPTSQTLTYAIDVENAGPNAATSVEVTDTLPAGVSFSSAFGTDWACNEDSHVVTCTCSSLSVGPAAPITITVTPTSSNVVTNFVSVDASEVDPNLLDNDASATTVVGPGPDLIFADGFESGDTSAWSRAVQ